jgi:transcriptional regulator with XRE-family HTH domain
LTRIAKCGRIATMSAHKSHLTPAQVFGLRVRETRERRGWDQGELAERLHIHRTTLNKIEKGSRSDVSISQLFEFAKVLDIAPVHLLTPRLDDAGLVVTPGSKPMRPRDARGWIRGDLLLSSPDPVGYLLDLPIDEQRLVLEALLTQGMSPLTAQLAADSLEAKVDEIVDAINKKEENRG